MRAVAHARLTTAAAVLAAGMGGGHLLMPHAPGASPARGVAFYALMLAVGAWRGWREARVRAEWGGGPAPGAPVGRSGAPGAGAPAGAYAAAYAVGAALLAALAYRVMHGG